MMSEPPLKKKRTILDYFKGNDKGKMSKKENTTVDKAEPGEKTPLVSPNKSSLKESIQGANALGPESVAGGSTNGPDHPVLSSQESLEETLQMTPELFSDDSQEQELDIPAKKPSQRVDGCLWKGKALPLLKKRPTDTWKLPHLHPDESHHIMFKLPFVYDGKQPPSPHPSQFRDMWDTNHVRMPCSNSNEYPVKRKDGKSAVRRRWDIITEALSKDIPGIFELEEAILSYNTRYTERWNFETMYHFFLEEISEEERGEFFGVVLKQMAKLALQLPYLVTKPIPLLKKGKSKSITFSQQQIACLLANAFFCTFPRRNARQKSSEFSNYPSVNFNSLFDGHPNQRKLEKLKCIIHYFRRVVTKMPTGTVTFKRHCIPGKFPPWDKLDTTLTDIHVSAEGTIEDDGDGLLQVDFANKYIGGGVLGMGCVQEEIRFLICPEMIISRLFTECLEKNECFYMSGCERFSNYEGYASSFRWSGDFKDKTERDDWGRMCTDVVAIDALVIRSTTNQFNNYFVRRELNKAYCGFVCDKDERQGGPLSAVCTGNWGCGAFGGDKRLKALIQLMAASAAGRDMCYFTFDDVELRDELYEIHQYLTKTNQLGIGNIMPIIEQYERHVISRYPNKKRKNHSLFQYIPKVFDGSLEGTDSEPESPCPEEFSPSNNEMQYFNEEEDNYDEKDKMNKSVKEDKSVKGHKPDVDNITGSVRRQESVDYKAATP